MDVSVIIVTHNSRSVLEPCLETLKRQSMFDRSEVIVVDNASSDGTPEYIRDRHPWIQFLGNTHNAGFSVGVNLGIQKARGRYFLILNPDTIVREHAISLLYEFMERTPDAGVAAPKLVYGDGNLQYSCRRFYTWRVLLLRRTPLGKVFKNSKAVSEHLMTEFDHDSTSRVDWVLGACMLVRREAVESVGLMDERFFLYFEDVDWCYRMKQNGWGVYYHPEAVVVHAHARQSAQGVFNRSFVAHFASLIRYYEKWGFVAYVFKKYREIIKIAIFVGADLFAVNIGFLSAYLTRAALDASFTSPLLPLSAYGQFVLFENILFVFVFLVLGQYRIRRGTRGIEELVGVGRPVIVAGLLLMVSTYLSQSHDYSRTLVAFLVPYTILYAWLFRGIVRRAHRTLLINKLDLKRVCIIGSGTESVRLQRDLIGDPLLGVDVVGIIRTDEDERVASIGDLSQIDDVIEESRVQELIFFSGAVPDEQLAALIELARRRVLDVTVLTARSTVALQQAVSSSLAGRPAIVYPKNTGYALRRFVKRVADVAAGMAFLVVSAPCWVLYYVYSAMRGATPFSRERRLGLRRRSFMLPLAGTRSSNGPSDIVNLPLFWSVVTGKVSLVGPYPLPAEYADRTWPPPNFCFDMRPGLTGPWRAGPDGVVVVHDLLAVDAAYAKSWSLTGDVRIFMKTFGSILLGRKRSLRLEHRGSSYDRK